MYIEYTRVEDGGRLLIIVYIPTGDERRLVRVL